MAAVMPDFRTAGSVRLFLIGKKGSDFFTLKERLSYRKIWD